MIPVSLDLNAVLSKKITMNFGLQFEKYVELNESNLKAKTKNGGKETNYDIFLENYKRSRNREIDSLLLKKHIDQIGFQKTFGRQYDVLSIHAKLLTRLVSGLGQTHPTETGITLDHNLGIPYLPAASIKGLVRATRRFECDIQDEKDDGNSGTFIHELFGKQERRGKVIFMDAYPLSVPNLEIDILTPHYGDYYNKDNVWPGDWLEPNPVKFLTVVSGTEYIFRALVEKSEPDLLDTVLKTYKTALCEVGVGGKTAVGYGCFEILSNEEHPELSVAYEKFVENDLTPEERYGKKVSDFITQIENCSDNNVLNDLFNSWQNDEMLVTDKKIAELFLSRVRKKKKNGEWTSYYKTLSEILGFDLTDDAGDGDPGSSSPVADPSIEKYREKMEKIIQRGHIDKKELKKLKKYKKHFPDLFSRLEKLVK